MPVPLRTNHLRTGAKNNVTTEFPSFGLHSAASTGNVGLVDYALSRGQPVNSVIDGVLPLHAACAGGNVHVVKLLIDYGADVNAPRLPKRISSRDSSVPIIGTTGSTPLHFAAANGNKEVIMLLLLHGAHADRPDKHGVTPEALARQNGWTGCANDLKQWIINKDRDLREREEFVTVDDGRRRNRIGSFGDQEPTHRRCLHVKQSIDTALNVLRSSSSNPAEVYHRGVHTLVPSDNGQITDLSIRRPSLPHVIQSDSSSQFRKPFAHNQRPRSAGGGTEETASIPSTRTSRRLASKVSLLNLFRKGQSEDNSSNANLPISDAPSFSASPVMISGFSLTQHRQRSHHDSDASIRSRKMTDLSLNSPVPTAVDVRSTEQCLTNRDRSKSNSNNQCDRLADDPALTCTNSYHSPGSSPLTRISLLRSHQSHHRTRSGSGSSLGYETNMSSQLGVASATMLDDDSANGGPGGVDVNSDNLSRSPLSRSGILRLHNRNGSNGQGHMTPSALRTLSSRNSDVASHPSSPRGTPARMKSSNSNGSLARSDSYPRQQRSMRRGSVESMSGFKQGDDDGDAHIEAQENEEEYGKPIESTEVSLLIGATKSPSSSGSLSPIISDDQAIGEGESALIADFPFSINRPPSPMPREDDVDEANALTTSRGDSLGSVKVTDNQEYSKANRTASTTMDVVPLMSSEVPPTGAEVVDTDDETRRSQYSINPLTTYVSASFSPLLSPPSQIYQSQQLDLGSRTAHASFHSSVDITPPSTLILEDGSDCKALELDISSISTHAQAEALAEQLRQQVMEFASLNEQELEFEPGNDGRTPLSARLAAYGESLALARKFKELENGGGNVVNGVTARSAFTNEESTGTSASATNLVLSVANHPSDSSGHSGPLHGMRSVGGLRGMPSPRSVSTGLNGAKHPKKSSRPSSAEGLASRDHNLSLSSELSFQSMQSMTSTSDLSYRADTTPPHQQSIPTLNVSDAEDDGVHQPLVLIESYISGSRTPAGEREMDHTSGTSRMTSLDGMGYVGDEFGEALYRVSTAPLQAPRLPPGRSAKKLSKMGISVANQAGIGMAAPQVAAHSGKKFNLKSFFRVGKP